MVATASKQSSLPPIIWRYRLYDKKFFDHDFLYRQIFFSLFCPLGNHVTTLLVLKRVEKVAGIVNKVYCINSTV